MPEREMLPVHVYLNEDGGVTLRQEGAYIALHPIQVPIVVEWLQQVAAEAEAQAAQAGGA